MIRIGQSSDIHQLVEGRDLILGGVKIEHTKGLLGHSDADALLHAIGEALLGAVALGDLGKHFPDKDPKWKGADSLVILKGCNELLKSKGFHVVNVDSLIMIERPKMSPHIDQMRKNIAEALGTDVENISVKATRGEKMGFVGREEGVLAQAVVLVESD